VGSVLKGFIFGGGAVASVGAAEVVASHPNIPEEMPEVAGEAADLGFKSFQSFKAFFGPAGEGMDWHHIVGQHQGNIEQFGAESIHNMSNIAATERALHTQISAFYSSVQPFSEGMTVREWLSTKEFGEQMMQGMMIMEVLANQK
jgi:hypothetical protein